MYKIDNFSMEMLKYLDDFGKKNKYKPLSKDKSKEQIEYYKSVLPKWCKLDGDNILLMNSSGTPLSHRYDRIVIGDYGAYVEISSDDIYLEHIICKRGQEYRINDERYSNNVKYNWLTTNDLSDIKIYFQKKLVSYADYKIGYYYVSPYELFVNK